MTSVEVIDDYVIRVTFDDGVVRDVDLSRSFVGRDRRRGSPEAFATVRLERDRDTLVWDAVGFHEHGEALYDL